MSVFAEGRKPEYPEENPRSRVENQHNKLNPHMTPGPCTNENLCCFLVNKKMYKEGNLAEAEAEAEAEKEIQEKMEGKKSLSLVLFLVNPATKLSYCFTCFFNGTQK